MECDVIVNAANNSLLGGGGVDGAIHRAAGAALLVECKTLGGCDTGKAKITKGYNLPAKYIIHTVGPIWIDGKHGEKKLLESCYKESLKIAVENNCYSIAFPIISAGVYGYPKAEALQVAMKTCSSFLSDHDLMIYIVIFENSSLFVNKELYADLSKYIINNYITENESYYSEASFLTGAAAAGSPPAQAISMSSQKSNLGLFRKLKSAEITENLCHEEISVDLENAISQIDESFSQMLLRIIDEKGLTDVQCYKKANIDRKLFSKIRSDINYKPKKITVIAFAAALELSIEDTKEMLMKAGYALSHSCKFDIIIEYFITNRMYDIIEINEALFAFEQPLIGG